MTTTSTATETSAVAPATAGPATMEQIMQVDGAASRVGLRARLLDSHAVDMWVELAAVDPDHPLHVKPGDPHWHLWISEDHQDPGTADNPYSIVRDAADDLSAIADNLAEYAHLLESKRDALHELDGLEIHETQNGARLMAKIIELGNSIKEAAQVRALAHHAAELARDARQVASWAFVPPSRRPATYGRHNQAENTRLLRQRLNGVIVRINRFGDRTNGAEGSGFRVAPCTEAGCEIAAAAYTETDEPQPVTVHA
ncbi:hypothetical protein [Nocardia sp. NRRL S-836]|uniref:hypothetical protein n=1 Tax=Nocardia sp. NRRL S-836 TaxID=1519492 RepID=UPI0006B05563|nr:hypothetical protein [Nocardia sp. NRRL S-836]KOV84751.1 hypothetical protein ADL03_15925 [Nocardia sp. NRRL S-836]